MSDTKPGMLPGDEFSFAEWRDAQGQGKTTPSKMPLDVQMALNDLADACQKEGMPFFVVVGMQQGDITGGHLGSTPQNVSHAMLLARSAMTDDQGHKMVLMAHSLQGLNLGAFNL